MDWIKDNLKSGCSRLRSGCWSSIRGKEWGQLWCSLAMMREGVAGLEQVVGSWKDLKKIQDDIKMFKCWKGEIEDNRKCEFWCQLTL